MNVRVKERVRGAVNAIERKNRRPARGSLNSFCRWCRVYTLQAETMRDRYVRRPKRFKSRRLAYIYVRIHLFVLSELNPVVKSV